MVKYMTKPEGRNKPVSANLIKELPWRLPQPDHPVELGANLGIHGNSKSEKWIGHVHGFCLGTHHAYDRMG